jgi:uncharacterized protein YndB with AHSA1/START domain
MSEPLERRVHVRCRVEHAFHTFTDRIDAWWPPGHRRFERSTLHLEPRVGGRFVERAATGEEAELGRVLRWEPPHRLTYAWWPGGGTGPTEVDVRFDAEGDGTRVSIRHAEGESRLGGEWPTRVKKFANAWSVVLPAFARFAANEGPGEDR